MVKKQPNWPWHVKDQSLAVSDALSIFRMDCLTKLARKLLPEGYWGEAYVDCQGERSAFLTFDDGPDPHTTPWLLEMLEAEGIVATFFLVGCKVKRHEHLVEKIDKAGHKIGNHSFNHYFMPMLPLAMIEKEIDKTNQCIMDVTGKAVEIFRPPYGVIDKRGASELNERGMKTVYWGPVSEDWTNPGSRQVISRVMHRMEHGALIVLHESMTLSRQTLVAAKEIICKGKKLGYNFVGVPNFSQTPMKTHC